ncbi:V-type ATP synthase subunit E family protein [uncultured Flavonifractor sp.]|uniref:V-type ATP synthase subunit E n=1 Tax=uncultured Flavonifractor sp. TaxID=1193534 RepID=UPI00174B83E2|nr:V-type ATP synthase subunit E family protein [uncultured Flavonifractor sp.]
MNGLEKLTGQIDADVQKEIDAALVQARSQAQEIQSWYESQAQIQVEAIRRKGQQDAVFRQERLVDEAKMQARRDILATKQELIGRAFDLALEKLLELPEKEYVALLADLAVKASSTKKEAVIFSQKDRTRYGKTVVTQANEKLGGGHLTLSEQTRPIKGGLILQDSQVETNCSFEVLIHLQRNTLSAEVAQVLFKE